jgi:regulator of protease activity HflC (stomatin/prohibitin superfamily)
MNQLRHVPFLSHVRTEPSTWVAHYKGGRRRRAGRGLAFWFRPLDASIAQVPMDDRELDLMFHGRSSDFQDVTAQGVVTYRVTDPDLAAERIDFSISLEDGRYLRTPLEQIAALLTQHAQQYVWDYMTTTTLRTILVDGVGEVRARIRDGLASEERIAALGIEVVAVRVAAVRPTSDVEQALQAPVREQIQQQADEATFQRRAMAVEKERAIEENELQNRIELARREEQLVAQRGANERLQATEEAAAARIAAEAQAHGIEVVEEARVAGERERMAIFRELDPKVLLALAARDGARKLRSIEHLNVSPDMLSPVLASLAAAGTRRLDDRDA